MQQITLDSFNNKEMSLKTDFAKSVEIENNSEINKEKLSKFKSSANKKIGNKKIRFGQFLTSEEIANFMVSLSSKNENSKILEPSAGKGVFLDSLKQEGFKNISAIEYDDEFFNFLNEKYSDINLIHNDFLNSNKDDKFDLIIGNPPYVQWNNIEPKIRLNLTESSFWSKYINGEWDIFYSFMIWSIEKLKDNGELIFIIPYNWFNSTHAKSLREYLINHGYFDIILHFGELKLFGDCFPNNIIFKFIKSKDRNKKIKVCDYEDKKANIHLLLQDINDFLNNDKTTSFNTTVKCFEMNQFQSPNMWFLGNDEDVNLLNKIEESTKFNNSNIYTRLSDYLNVGVGIVTGFDKAFIIDENELKQISEHELKYIFKFVKAKNCERYNITTPSYYIFADDITDEEELKKYPYIYNKLIQNKNSLEKRYMSKNKKWWHWATVRNLELFKNNLNEEKIFIPCMDRSLKTRFSFTIKPFYGSGDVLMIAKTKSLKENFKFILAWLNSDLINRWYRIKGSKKGQRIQYTQSYVSKIPLKLINWNNQDEVNIHNEVVDLIDKILNGENKEQIEKEIDLKFQKLITL